MPIVNNKKRSIEAAAETQNSSLEKQPPPDDEKKRKISALESQVLDLERKQSASARAQKKAETDVAVLKTNVEWYKTGMGQVLDYKYWQFMGWE